MRNSHKEEKCPEQKQLYTNSIYNFNCIIQYLHNIIVCSRH